MNNGTAPQIAKCFTLVTLVVCSARASVTLNPGDNIQTAISNNPEGTTFILNAGIYRLAAGLRPKANDVFTGQPGAVLNGSRLLTAWTQQSGRWTIQTPVQHSASTSLRCTPATYTGCHYDDAVFYDDTPLWRVTDISDLAPGKVYVDPSADRVYLADNPVGHKVEIAASTRAFISAQTGISNVTIQGLIIEKFANAGGDGALEAGSDWTILNNEIRNNHGMGLSDGKVIRGNYVHHNGELGLGGGYGNSGIVVENNEISFNNWAGFDWYMEGGGTKWSNTNSLTVRGNYVHDNIGPGLWADGDNVNALYENNHTRNNAGPGIFDETNFNSTIRNNLVEYDSLGAAGTSLWWGAGIYLNSSSGTQIYGNTVSHCLHGIGGSSTNHGVSPLNGKRYIIQDVYVHNNIIILDSGTAGGFVRDNAVVTTEIFTSWNNHFDFNTYFLGNLPAPFQWMDADRTINEWRAFGNDTHGTFLGIAAATPTVSIASPVNGATVSGNVTVQANVADPAGLAKVEFYVDGSLKATNQGASGTFTWIWASVGAGSHTLSVKAYGVEGNTASAQVSVMVGGSSGDTTPPTVSISSPAATSTVSGVVTITAVPNDNIGVARVQFYADGFVLGVKFAAPWTLPWNAANTSAGLHSIIVVAYDAAGNSRGAAILVTVGPPPDTTRPSVHMTFPTNNMTVSGAVTITATASDNIGVTKVEFYVEGTLLGTRASAPWNFPWDTTKAAAGPNMLGVVAYDAAGNHAGSTISVTVLH